MHPADGGAGGGDLGLHRQVGEGLGARSGSVAGQQHAPLGVQAVARVPDQRGVAPDPGDAAEDLRRLPEPWGLEADLVGIGVGYAGHGGLHRRGEIRRDARQDRQGNGDDRKVRGQNLLRAAGLAVSHLHAVRRPGDTAHLGRAQDGAGDGPLEPRHDLVHAAHRLEHGGLHVDIVLEQGRPKLRIGQKVPQRDRRAALAELVGGAGRLGEARSLRTLEAHILRQVAIGPQEGQQLLLVGQGQLSVQGALVDRLGQQFGDMAAGVVDPLAQLDRLAAVGLVTPQKGAAADIDLHFERHAQLAAIGQQALMVAGNAGRARIHVDVLLKGDGLVGLAHHLDLVAAAQGPVTTAEAIASLQDGHGEPGPLQLIGADQTRDPGPQDHHPTSLAKIRRQGRGGGGGLGGVQPECGHCAIGRPQPAHGPQAM